jgi:hypothetical protein
LPFADDGLAENNFDLRRTDRDALDGVWDIVLSRRVCWWAKSLFALRACDIDAGEAVACLTRQMCPDSARNAVFDLCSGNADD